jgi:hypothetical protein
MFHYSMITKDLALRLTRIGGSNLGWPHYLKGVMEVDSKLRVDLLSYQSLLNCYLPMNGISFLLDRL